MYIVGEEKYNIYNENKITRLIPKGILKKLKPKVLDIVYNLENEEIGIIGNINMGEEKIHKLILGIEKIKGPNTKYLILEERELFNREDIHKIETETGLQVLDGLQVIIHFFPLVLKENLMGKEILIFNENLEITKEFILSISKDVKSITLVEEDENIVEEIYNYILEKTGLSIFHSKDINKILKNYSIIINFNGNIKIDEGRLRKEVLIFDFSLEKPLKNMGKYPVVEDFIFKGEALNMKENKWIGAKLSSAVYEYFKNFQIVDFMGLLVDGEVYSPKNFISGKIRHIRRL